MVSLEDHEKRIKSVYCENCGNQFITTKDDDDSTLCPVCMESEQKKY